MSFSIRQATGKDFSLVQALNAALFESDSGNDPYLDRSWPYSKKGVRYYTTSLTSPQKLVLIALTNEGEPLGYVIGSCRNKFSWRKGKTGELENILVVPRARGSGIGRALVAGLLLWMKERNVDRVFVSAYAKNARAIGFYEQCGFARWATDLELVLNP